MFSCKTWGPLDLRQYFQNFKIKRITNKVWVKSLHKKCHWDSPFLIISPKSSHRWLKVKYFLQVSTFMIPNNTLLFNRFFYKNVFSYKIRQGKTVKSSNIYKSRCTEFIIEPINFDFYRLRQCSCDSNPLVYDYRRLPLGHYLEQIIPWIIKIPTRYCSLVL